MERSRAKVRAGVCTPPPPLLGSTGFCCCVSPAGGREVEPEDSRSRSNSRDPLTPEPQDPAPQKKRKKKKPSTVGSYRVLQQQLLLGPVSASSCYLPPSDHEAEQGDLPNGAPAEAADDGEDTPVAVTKRTKRKR